jgi:hypothetical protein
MDVKGLNKLAAGQHGLFTRAQARRLGASAHLVRHRIYTGEWVVVLGDVLAVAGLPLTRRVRQAAALLDLPATVLAGPSAARLLGLDCPDHRIFVAGQTSRRAPAMVRVLREPVPVSDVMRVDGFPVTVPARTTIDCMRVLRDEQAVALLEAALRAGRVSAKELACRVQERAGRRGTPRLVALLNGA